MDFEGRTLVTKQERRQLFDGGAFMVLLGILLFCGGDRIGLLAMIAGGCWVVLSYIAGSADPELSTTERKS